MSNREKWKEAKTVLRKITEHLSSLPVSEITQWPEWPQVPIIKLEIPEEYKSIKFTPMKDTLANGTIRVAVQMYKHHFLGIGSMSADGFYIEPNGSIRWFKEEDTWEVT